MNMRISKVPNKDGSIELYFEGVGHWDDFDLILALLQKENDCKILSNQEVIYIRKAELLRDGIKFHLIQDDMLGNYLYTTNIADVPILENLAGNVIESIKIKLSNLQK